MLVLAPQMALFRINTPQVISQVFDTEVVIIHLETGTYYSLGGSGIAIWRRIEKHSGIESTAAAFCALSPARSATIKTEVEAFFASLEREKLITAADTDSCEGIAEQDESYGEFVTPSLERFTDMQDLLLLDPIHELDAAGWPERPAAGGPNP